MNHELRLQRKTNNEGLKEHEKYILIGLLAKITDLIALYSMKNLKEHIDYIKSEIRLGIFQDIVVANKHYTNDDRKRLVNLAGKWNDNDLARYNNLLLLKLPTYNLWKAERRLAYAPEPMQRLGKLIANSP